MARALGRREEASTAPRRGCPGDGRAKSINESANMAYSSCIILRTRAYLSHAPTNVELALRVRGEICVRVANIALSLETTVSDR